MATRESRSVKVLNTWASAFGLRVLIALQERGVEYEYEEQNLWCKSQLLMQSNPIHQQVPVLLHGGNPICESLIIVLYIDEAWPSQDGHSFLPAHPLPRALARFWADYVDKKVFDAGRRIIASREGDLRDQAKKDLKECLVTLDEALRESFGGGPYFGGEQIGLVDIALAPFLCWFEAYEVASELNQEVCPHLCKWAKAVLEYPSVKKALSIAPPHKVVEFSNMIRKTSYPARSK